jgi:hypothetical protein
MSARPGQGPLDGIFENRDGIFKKQLEVFISAKKKILRNDSPKPKKELKSERIGIESEI